MNVLKRALLLIDLKMAMNDVILARFSAQCRGVKLYDLAECFANRGDRLVFVRNPHHEKDKNCVEALLARNRKMLGHVAAEVARFLSPMLLGPYDISG